MIHVVVSCTERKSVPPLGPLRASKLTRRSFNQRVQSWVELISATAPTIEATDLYQGEHWAVARDLVDTACAEVWVASAGYGLVNARTLIAPYAATFAPRQVDSIMLSTGSATMDEERSTWWRALQRGANRAHVSIEALAADGPLLIAASRPYLAAMEQDLLDADSVRGRRIVLTTAGPVPTRVQHLRTPATGKLRTILGGSLQAVSVRLASRIVQSIDEVDLTHSSVVDLTVGLMAQASPLESFSRSSLSDDEVSAYISNALRTDSPPSCSALLRAMRDGGTACEQSRFRRLYLAAKETVDSNT